MRNQEFLILNHTNKIGRAGGGGGNQGKNNNKKQNNSPCHSHLLIRDCPMSNTVWNTVGTYVMSAEW